MVCIRWSGALGAMTLALALAGCGDTSSPNLGDDAEEVADLAAIAGDAVAEDVAVVAAEAGTMGPNASPPPPADDHFAAWVEPCAYDGAISRFLCPTVTRGTLTVSRSYALADADGNPQDTYYPLTTATAQFSSTIIGVVERPHWSATIDRRRELAFTGLAGSETQRTVNGTGTSAVHRSRHVRPSGERTYDFDASITIADVIVPVAGNGEPWPLSGSVTRDVTVSREGPYASGTRTRTVMVRFNGTRFVPLTINGREFTLDLATGAVSDEG